MPATKKLEIWSAVYERAVISSPLPELLLLSRILAIEMICTLENDAQTVSEGCVLDATIDDNFCKGLDVFLQSNLFILN